jgi:hypothetical protein
MNRVSEERSASIIRVTRIGELGTTLALTSNRRTLRRKLSLLPARRFLSPWWWRHYVPPKHRFLQVPHGVSFQKIAACTYDRAKRMIPWMKWTCQLCTEYIKNACEGDRVYPSICLCASISKLNNRFLLNLVLREFTLKTVIRILSWFMPVNNKTNQSYMKTSVCC